MIQVAIIEDDEPFLVALANLINIQSDMRCVLRKTTIGSFYEFLDLDQRPDILLLDQQLGQVNSVDHLEKIYKLLPDIPIIIMTGYENPKAIRKSLLLGISGYYFKGEDPMQLLTVIREVSRGNAYLSPRASKIAMDMIRRSKDDVSPEPHAGKITGRLPWNATHREMNVIRGLIDGRSYKEIAASNYMTIDGVRYYVRSIYPKLGVSTRDQLVRVLTR